MKLVVGAGYLGSRVARSWRDRGDDVAAVTRSTARSEKLAAEGIRPIVADVTVASSLADLPAADTVLFAVGYDRTSGMPHRDVYVEGLRNVLSALANSSQGDTVRRFIYISTTGVYAASEHDEVDEGSPCEPTTPGAIAHFEAEQLLLASPIADRAIVLRMAGLYGEERVPRVEELRAGQLIAAASDGFVNLIQVDDAASVILAAESRGMPPRLYNVSDGHPANRREYLQEVARLIGAPEPEFVEPSEDAAPTRGSASKRISNRRMMAELGVELRCPSFREGLAASL
jgi:nucleoside-diphosphate-sugar epimerase